MTMGGAAQGQPLWHGRPPLGHVKRCEPIRNANVQTRANNEPITTAGRLYGEAFVLAESVGLSKGAKVEGWWPERISAIEEPRLVWYERLRRVVVNPAEPKGPGPLRGIGRIPPYGSANPA